MEYYFRQNFLENSGSKNGELFKSLLCRIPPAFYMKLPRLMEAPDLGIITPQMYNSEGMVVTIIQNPFNIKGFVYVLGVITP